MKKQTTAEEIQAAVALFEGRSITLVEAKKIQLVSARRNKMLMRTFNLSTDEAKLLCAYKEEVSSLLKQYYWKKVDEQKEKMRQIEMRAVTKMRDPNRGRQMRALLAPR